MNAKSTADVLATLATLPRTAPARKQPTGTPRARARSTSLRTDCVSLLLAFVTTALLIVATVGPAPVA